MYMLIEKWEWKRLGGPRDRECDSPFEGARKSGCGGTLTNKRVFLTILATEGENIGENHSTYQSRSFTWLIAS